MNKTEQDLAKQYNQLAKKLDHQLKHTTPITIIKNTGKTNLEHYTNNWFFPHFNTPILLLQPNSNLQTATNIHTIQPINLQTNNQLTILLTDLRTSKPTIQQYSQLLKKFSTNSNHKLFIFFDTQNTNLYQQTFNHIKPQAITIKTIINQETTEYLTIHPTTTTPKKVNPKSLNTT